MPSDHPHLGEGTPAPETAPPEMRGAPLHRHPTADREVGPPDPDAYLLDDGPSIYLRFVKPTLDRLVALLLLVLLAPVLLASMLAVRISLGPGILFRQQRVGLHGRLFTTYKLRTMRHDRRDDEGDLRALREGAWDGVDRRRTHKHPLDPRLTRVGEWLRKLSLDEIPQLFNILKGDMAVVGPRPELPMIVERHYAPWQHRRHAVKPGLTGLWQVSERGNGMMHEHIDVDLDYVDRVGPLTDLRILLATPYAVLGPRKGF